jgi:hypothetical protein
MEGSMEMRRYSNGSDMVDSGLFSLITMYGMKSGDRKQYRNPSPTKITVDSRASFQ